MADNLKTEWVGRGTRQQLVERNHGLVEEVKILRQHVADMYRAWMDGKAPPPPPPSFLDSVLTRTMNPMPDDLPHSPYIPTYHNFSSHSSSSITRPPTMFSQRYSRPQHHYSPRDNQNRTSPSRYPAPRKAYQPPRTYRKPPGSGFRPNKAFREERLLKREKALTPIGESYASLFEKLKHVGLITPLPEYTPDPRARSFDPTARCAYHSNVRGHDIESCRTLKKEIERMIQKGWLIVVNDDDMGHTNPLGGVPTGAKNVEADGSLGNIDAELSG